MQHNASNKGPSPINAPHYTLDSYLGSFFMFFNYISAENGPIFIP